MQQAKPCPIKEEAEAGRLSVVLRNPSAEWSDIRAAMKSKAQGRACTNLAVMTSLASAGAGSSSNCKTPRQSEKDTTVAVKDVQAVAKEEPTDAAVSAVDRLMPLGDRRASLSSQDSSMNNLTSRRGITRQTSRRRTMRRQGSLRNSRRLLLRSSVNASMKSITLESLDESSSNFNSSSSDFKNSSIEFNNSSFKDSINIMDFGISQQLGLRAALALDENHQSCLSLDESALEDLREEYDRSKRGLLVSWRHDSRISDLDGSTRSEGDLDGSVDSCGFMAWPAAKEGEEEESVGDGTAVEDSNTHTFNQEETTDEVQQHVEEWNISDYEVGDDSDQGRTRKNSMSMAMAKTIERFSMPKRFSRISSTLSQKDDDLMKIKETLPTLLAKNKLQQSGEAEAAIGKKKREGPMSLIQAEKAADGPTGRKSDELIWAKDDSCNSLGFDYKTLYAQTPKKAQQRKSWNIFEGVKGNVRERRSSD